MSRKSLYKEIIACIIEDNLIDRHLILETLKLIGVNDFVCFVSFVEAFITYSNCLHKLPDILIADCDNESYFEVKWQAWYSCSRLCEVPAFLLTSTEDQQTLNIKQQIKNSQIIIKPVTLTTLEEMIVSVLSK